MAKSYSELESKLGAEDKSFENEKTQPESKKDNLEIEADQKTAEKAVESAGLNMDQLQSEYDANGTLDEKSFAALENFFICPALLAQNDLRLFAALDPGLTFPVTAVLSFEPGLSRLYLATPAAVIPAPLLVERKYFLLRGGIVSPPRLRPIICNRPFLILCIY